MTEKIFSVAEGIDLDRWTINADGCFSIETCSSVMTLDSSSLTLYEKCNGKLNIVENVLDNRCNILVERLKDYIKVKKHKEYCNKIETLLTSFL
jgi:hypothetical protein